MAIRILNSVDCAGCRGCTQICPKGCIEMRADREGFSYPFIDDTACVGCGLCEQVCPMLHPAELSASVPEAYAAYCPEDDIRESSSSGGLFTVLASAVLKKGGIVFGAALTEDQSVCHIGAETDDELKRLRGSKYLQSNVGNTYRDAKIWLDSGRTVYYSGTPCQIEGLLRFLGKPYGNLITQDIICHGVPSPLVWRQYVELREKTANAKSEEIFFRNKRLGWLQFSMHFRFENRDEYTQTKDDDLFLRCFLKNWCLRPSCYACRFKKESRAADITLADYWGVREDDPEMFDDRGTSLVLLHTEKGKRLFGEVEQRLKWKPADYAKAIGHNGAYLASVALPEERALFFKYLPEMGFEKTMKKVLEAERRRKRKSKYGIRRTLRRMKNFAYKMTKKLVKR